MILIEKRVDWSKIRGEYISGDTSYRKLASKYSVCFSTLKNKAKKEDWPGLREKASHKADANMIQKIAAISADNASTAQEIKRRLLLRLKRIEEKYPMDATEVRMKKDDNIAVFRIRDLTAAYKDLTEDMPSAAGVDIEDLTPLGELLK